MNRENSKSLSIEELWGLNIISSFYCHLFTKIYDMLFSLTDRIEEPLLNAYELPLFLYESGRQNKSFHHHFPQKDAKRFLHGRGTKDVQVEPNHHSINLSEKS
ncbi:hypothetical protein ACJX0J_015377 [Zea mays]